MDLGITGRKALVCGASKGLGRGCAEALAQTGADVTIVARTEDAVRRAAQEIEALAGRGVGWVACDVTTEDGRSAALAACPRPDILVNNAAGPPPGDFRTFDRDDWIRAIDANMLAPIASDQGDRRRHDRPRLRTHRQHHLVGGEGADRRARAVERRAQRADRLRRRARAERCPAQRDDQQPAARIVRDRSLSRDAPRPREGHRHVGEETLQAIRKAIPAGRVGVPAEFGAACAFLCSAQAGYIVGQNILIDGGAYPGTFDSLPRETHRR